MLFNDLDSDCLQHIYAKLHAGDMARMRVVSKMFQLFDASLTGELKYNRDDKWPKSIMLYRALQWVHGHRSRGIVILCDHWKSTQKQYNFDGTSDGLTVYRNDGGDDDGKILDLQRLLMQLHRCGTVDYIDVTQWNQPFDDDCVTQVIFPYENAYGETSCGDTQDGPYMDLIPLIP